MGKAVVPYSICFNITTYSSIKWSTFGTTNRVLCGGGGSGNFIQLMIQTAFILLLALRGANGTSTAPSAAPSLAPTSGPSSARSSQNTIKLFAGVNAAFSKPTGSGGFATSAGLVWPRSVWMDTVGIVYIGDYSGYCVRTVDSSNIINDYAGVCGKSGNSGDGGNALLALFASITSIFVSSTGVLYMVDQTSYRVRQVSTSGIISAFLSNGLTLISSDSGDGGAASSAGIVSPFGVWGNTVGVVYVTGMTNSMVRAIDTANIVSRFAGYSGGQGFNGDGGPALSASLYTPRCIHGDTTGVVYISDQDNYRIRSVSPSGIISTVVGTGNLDYNGDGLAGTSTNIEFPFGIAVDSSNGDIYAVSSSYNRVFVLTATSKTVSTFGGTGDQSYNGKASTIGNDGPATSANLYHPEGLYLVQGSRQVYVVDTGTALVRLIYSTSPTPLPTVVPTTTIPTLSPFVNPTLLPTVKPTIMPTVLPTIVPTAAPSHSPTVSPTLKYLSIRSSPSYTVTNALAFAGITSGGSVLCWGASSSGGDCSSVSGSLKDVVEVVSSKNAFVALTSTGSVVAWGSSRDISGWSDATSGVTVVSVTASEKAFAGVSAAGAVVAFGADCCGGNVDQYGAWSSLYLSSDVSSVRASAGAICALKTDGSVYCWGSAFAGGGVSSVSRSDLSDIVLLSSTRSSFAGVKSDGSVVVWGNNQLGGSLTAGLFSSSVMHIVSNAVSFTAYTSDYSLVSWGAVSGAMTMGSEVKYIAHTSQAFAAVRNNGSVVSWGDASAGGGVALSENVTEIVGNNAAFAAVLYDGSVSVWGDSDWGGIGSLSTTLANITSVYRTSRAFAAVDGSGGVTAWGSSGAGGTVSSAVSDNVKSDVRLVCANDMAFTAIKNDGSAYAWGYVKSVGDGSGAVEGDFSEIVSC